MKSTKILNRVIRIIRHFTPDVWPWEEELWRQRLCHGGPVYHLGSKLLDFPYLQGPSKKEQATLLAAVGEYLQPLGKTERCRNFRKPWRNLDYSPEGPIGDYHWIVTAQQVICLRRGSRELFEGFLSLENDRCRDGCPYQDPVRSAEWDIGYMIAHGHKYEPKKLLQWIRHHEDRIQSGEPAHPAFKPIPAEEI